jgi:hypothetical protein
MPAKQDYLRDLRSNPRSTSAEVLPRVQAPTLGAVETAFRKYADDGLVESDDSKPKLYTLTDKGAEELRRFESEAPNAHAVTLLPTRREESDLIAALAKRAKQESCRISFSIEPDNQPASSDERPVSSRVRALLERVNARLAPEPGEPEPNAPSVPWDNPKVQRLYGLQLGMCDLPRRIVREGKDALAAIIGNEVSEMVARLVEAEEELHSELEDSWWPDKEKRERLQQEIAELRRKLGCPEGVADSSGE